MTVMRIRGTLTCFLFICISFIGNAHGGTKRADTGTQITIASDEWCPYNCDSDSEKPGFMVEIAKAAFALNNIGVKYEVLNWSRALRLTHKSRIDGALGATYEEAEDAGLEYGTQPMGLSYFAFVTLKENGWTYTNPKSLSKIRFGIVQDYDNGPVIDDYMALKPDNVLVQTGLSGFEKNMKLVMNGRLGAALDDAFVAAYKLSNMGISEYVKIVPLDEIPFAVSIAFKPGKEGKRLARLLDEGIIELRKSGELTQILAKYGLTDWMQTRAKNCVPDCATAVN